jgi:ribosomal protein S14
MDEERNKMTNTPDEFNRDKNLVRGVIMQDLGLTRESIREMVEEIVGVAIKKHITLLLNSGHVDKVVTEYLNELTRESRFHGPTIRSMVREATEKQVAEFVNSRIRIVAS